MPDLKKKKRTVQLAILGDGLVGKTAILRNFQGLKFDPNYSMTIGADLIMKKLPYHDKVVTLQIFDVGGQPQFSSLRSRYYGQAEAVIIVFDLMKRETFENIPNWFDEVLRINNYNFLPLMLLGNKEDLSTDEEYVVKQYEIDDYVSTLQQWGEQYDEKFSVVYNETSAKTGYNVENVFYHILDVLSNNL